MSNHERLIYFITMYAYPIIILSCKTGLAVQNVKNRWFLHSCLLTVFSFCNWHRNQHILHHPDTQTATQLSDLALQHFHLGMKYDVQSKPSTQTADVKVKCLLFWFSKIGGQVMTWYAPSDWMSHKRSTPIGYSRLISIKDKNSSAFVLFVNNSTWRPK